MAEMRVHVDNPTTDPVKVTGSITTSPSGTQNVSPVSSTAPSVNVTSVRSAAIDSVFVYSVGNVAGVVAANNYLSLFNPVGSGKLLSFGSAFISSTTAGGTTVTDPMQGFRITTATGGTLQATSTFGRFVTSEPDSVAEVRIGNPTVTLGAQLFNSPPAISATTGSTNVHIIPVPGGLQPFILAEGEGIVLRTLVGDTDLRWNLSVVWAEI